MTCASCEHAIEAHEGAVWPPKPDAWGQLDETPCQECSCTWFEGPEPQPEPPQAVITGLVLTVYSAKPLPPGFELRVRDLVRTALELVGIDDAAVTVG